MSSGFTTVIGGVEKDFDDLFDPDTVGDGPRTDVCFDSSGLGLKYAAIKYGSKGPDVGYSNASGVDVSNLWAAKGTASYTLPINGKSYAHDSGRGTASITVTIKSDGTYTVVGGGTLASGTWLPAGDSAASYTVQYSETGAASGPDDGGGSDSFSNGAPSQKSVSLSPAFSISASATTVLANAQNSCGLTITLYKNGVKRLSAWCDLEVSAEG